MCRNLHCLDYSVFLHSQVFPSILVLLPLFPNPTQTHREPLWSCHSRPAQILRLCTETAPWCLHGSMPMYVSLCECECAHIKPQRRRGVDLKCNENANCLSRVDLRCQSASQFSIAFQPLTQRSTINPDVTGTNYSTEPFSSFITVISISLVVMFSLHVQSIFLHRFLSSLHLSELFCLHPCFQWYSPPSHPQGGL